jgi:hypothetical protein
MRQIDPLAGPCGSYRSSWQPFSCVAHRDRSRYHGIQRNCGNHPLVHCMCHHAVPGLHREVRVGVLLMSCARQARDASSDSDHIADRESHHFTNLEWGHFIHINNSIAGRAVRDLVRGDALPVGTLGKLPIQLYRLLLTAIARAIFVSAGMPVIFSRPLARPI